MPVVALCPPGPHLREDALQRPGGEGARRAACSRSWPQGDTAGARDPRAAGSDIIFDVPPVDEVWSPLLMVLPLQLLAYHMAVRAGRDVDQPRNLAKSVTVE